MERESCQSAERETVNRADGFLCGVLNSAVESAGGGVAEDLQAALEQFATIAEDLK